MVVTDVYSQLVVQSTFLLNLHRFRFGLFGILSLLITNHTTLFYFILILIKNLNLKCLIFLVFLLIIFNQIPPIYPYFKHSPDSLFCLRIKIYCSNYFTLCFMKCFLIIRSINLKYLLSFHLISNECYFD
jgi:hypothetical protein